jgi:hypothetical protein
MALPDRLVVSRWTLRFCLLGGGVAWTLHLVGAWAIAEFGILAGFGAVNALILALSAVMLLAAGAATLVSALVRRRATDESTEAGRTVAFCARFGVVTNATFTAIIAAQTLPVFYFLGP